MNQKLCKLLENDIQREEQYKKNQEIYYNKIYF